MIVPIVTSRVVQVRIAGPDKQAPKGRSEKRGRSSVEDRIPVPSPPASLMPAGSASATARRANMGRRGYRRKPPMVAPPSPRFGRAASKG